MGGTTRGIRRVLVVAVIAVAAFAGAVVALGDDARRGCVVGAQVDPSYQVQLVGKVEAGTSAHELAVTHDGRPVEGAKVCASVSMVGMEAMGVSDVAEERGPGVYEVAIAFEMSGGWRGDILITERGRPAVSVPVRFEVS